MIRRVDGFGFIRACHRSRRRHVGDRLALLEESSADRGMFAPVDRPVEPEQAFQFALDVNHAFPIDNPHRASKVFMDQRQRGAELNRESPVFLAR